MSNDFRTADHGERRQRLAQSLAADSVDVLLVTNPVNVTYLTGFSGESSYLILGRDRAVLVSDGRFTEQLAEECPGLDVFIRPPVKTLPEATAEVLGKFGARGASFEAGHLTVGEFETLSGLTPALSWQPSRDRVERLRALKDAWEVEQIRQAVRIAERAFAMFRAMLEPDDSEKELSDALEAYVRRAGGRCSSFPAIVAVGERAALPHAPPTTKKVAEAGLLLVDWGASGPFYKSDLTRVLATRTTSTRPPSPNGGADDAKLEAVYAVVLEAQRQAIASVRPGVKAGEVDSAARSVIAQAGYGDYFTHSTGHGLGLQVHEAPLLKPGSEVVLEVGMVVTIEPGIYLPSWGGVRIEDDVLITPDGCEVLTSVPKDLASMTVAY
ncbi:MAG TPA: Xaa-Pro peptidase family protein [Gemmataceae bacterium]|nr:Xaa-Pro peptidase family protein [Gemmataceae bacterium]